VGGFGPIQLVILAAVGTIIGVWLVRRRGRIDGAEPLYPPADVTRLALASLILKGPGFRSLIRRRTANPFRALAPEPELDFPLVKKACDRFDQEELGYWWVLVVLTLALLLLRPPAPLTLLGLAGLVAVTLRRRWRVRFKLAPRFTRANYDPEALRRELGMPPEPPGPGAPVVCHGLSDPFVGLGVNFGGWNLAFDVSRPAEGQGAVKGDLDAAAMDQAITQSIRRLSIAGLTLDEVMFVNGAQSGPVGLQSDAYARPAAAAPEGQVAGYRYAASPVARVYRRALITDWSGELVLTFLFRCMRRGDVLVVEAAQLALTPPGAEYRDVDRMRELSPLGHVAWWAAAVAMTIPDVILAFATTGRRTFEVIDQALFGGDEGRERREIRADPAYNYGALWSLRTHMASKNYSSYFQKSDASQYFRAINEQSLNAVRDCLTEYGIDCRALGEQAVSIHNNSVQITAARDVSLSGVAVGAAATARTGAVGRALANAGGGRS